MESPENLLFLTIHFEQIGWENNETDGPGKVFPHLPLPQSSIQVNSKVSQPWQRWLIILLNKQTFSRVMFGRNEAYQEGTICSALKRPINHIFRFC